MRINGIAPYGVQTSNFKGTKIEKQAEGEDNYLVMFDKNNIATAENISNPKVGAKWVLKLNDPKYDGLRILISPESKVTSEDKSFYVKIDNPKNLAFKGNVYGSIRSDETGTDENMRNAYKTFFTTGLKGFVEKNYTDKEANARIKDDYSFFVPSDGDGTRYKDITLLQADFTKDGDKVTPKKVVTKPASEIPVNYEGHQMKLVQGVLTNFAKTGQLKEAEFIDVKPAQGSAYAFFEGLKAGTIPTDKPLVFVWGDNFSDIKIQPIMEFHEKTDADLTMLALPVKKERISALGAVQVKSEEDLTATWFMEKPQTEEEIAKAKFGSTDQYLGIVGPYVLSPKALNWIKENYTATPEKFHNAKGYDFSSTIIDTLVNKNEETGKDFNVQIYIKPEDETWSDLGSSKDFRAEMLKIKHDKNAYKYMPDFYKNCITNSIDSKDNISINPEAKAMLEQVEKEYGIKFENVVAYKV
ncbi:hypothetical protein IKA92_02530 [bacterium]|nr:hypothetical protein [bacterium]